MAESKLELFKRFYVQMNNIEDKPFFTFEDDEKNEIDHCYYLNISHFDTFASVVLNNINDQEIYSFEIDSKLLIDDKYMRIHLDIIINMIDLDIIESEKKLLESIKRNKSQLELLKSSLGE